jgi:hypothetical protein
MADVIKERYGPLMRGKYIDDMHPRQIFAIYMRMLEASQQYTERMVSQ